MKSGNPLVFWQIRLCLLVNSKNRFPHALHWKPLEMGQLYPGISLSQDIPMDIPWISHVFLVNVPFQQFPAQIAPFSKKPPHRCAASAQRQGPGGFGSHRDTPGLQDSWWFSFFSIQPSKQRFLGVTPPWLLWKPSSATTWSDRMVQMMNQIFQSLTGAFYVGNGWVAGGCWGLLGWLLIVSQWIIPENSLRLAPVRSVQLKNLMHNNYQ